MNTMAFFYVLCCSFSSTLLRTGFKLYGMVHELGGNWRHLNKEESEFHFHYKALLHRLNKVNFVPVEGFDLRVVLSLYVNSRPSIST